MESQTIKEVLPHPLYLSWRHFGVSHQLLPHLLQQVASVIELPLQYAEGVGKHAERSCDADGSRYSIAVGDISGVYLLECGEEGREIWKAMRLLLGWGILTVWDVVLDCGRSVRIRSGSS